jgi:uncharacterized protein
MIVPFSQLSKPARWCALISLSFVMVALLRLMQLPASLLLGAMIAAIFMELGGGRLVIPRLPYAFAQATIGCLVARIFTTDIMTSLLHRWPLYIGVTMMVTLVSSALGFLISKYKILPGTTAVWGLLPGGASVMIVMADSFGADMRLVALMQYMRVLFVAIAASLIARFWLQSTGVGATAWFPQIHWLAFGETLCLIVVSIFLAPRLRIPGGWLLLPMIIGAALQIVGFIQLELPQWLLGFSFALLGWTIGSRFTRESLTYAVRVLPAIILAILSIIAFCCLLALMLEYMLGVDLLTAYLATSPGGIDSAAIIAASTNVNMPFVMALQIMRLIISLLIGPPLALWTARKVEKHL